MYKGPSVFSGSEGRRSNARFSKQIGLTDYKVVLTYLMLKLVEEMGNDATYGAEFHCRSKRLPDLVKLWCLMTEFWKEEEAAL
jgi:hypothetical protein